MAKLTRNRGAQGVRISSVSALARAERILIVDSAVCILAARPRARVDALQPNARQVTQAVGMDRAFWPTAGRAAKVAWKARADGAAVELTTLRIRTTWVRKAGALRCFS